jgi:hypothetical protein
MWGYTKLIAQCRKLKKSDFLRDRYAVLEWRLMRRAKRLQRAK